MNVGQGGTIRTALADASDLKNTHSNQTAFPCAYNERKKHCEPPIMKT